MSLVALALAILATIAMSNLGKRKLVLLSLDKKIVILDKLKTGQTMKYCEVWR